MPITNQNETGHALLAQEVSDGRNYDFGGIHNRIASGDR
jgi:hypothetical protein